MPHQLDHEKLDVYQLELQFVAWSTELMAELLVSSAAQAHRVTETCDHLERAGLSALFNTAAGNGKRQMKTRAKCEDEDDYEHDYDFARKHDTYAGRAGNRATVMPLCAAQAECDEQTPGVAAMRFAEGPRSWQRLW